MQSGVLSNLNSVNRFGVQRALRVKQGQTLHLVEALPLKRTEKFEIPGLQIGSGRSMHSAIGALSQALTSAIVLSSSSLTSGHFKRIMAASSSVAASGDLVVDSFLTSCGNFSGIGKSSGVYFSNRGLNFCQKASLSLMNGEAQNRRKLSGYLVYDSALRPCNSNPLFGSLFKSYNTSSSTCYSNGDAPHALSQESTSDVRIANSDDPKISGDRALKLLSGSCYLPHPDKEATGGEDAHFICDDEQAVGVADGVGGWADVGVNAGEYSRQLMSNSEKAIQDESKELIDPAQVLEKAYIRTNAKGSSTACIIVLNDQALHAINLGDSGFIVVRDGCTIFESPVQQHGFNFTYQLENSNRSDLPSAGQVFNIPVLPGDVIVAGTDGLFDNLYKHEINAIVVNAVSSGFSPEVTAQKIAALARQRALDRTRQTPFSTAAQEAGFTYYGGKLDDITVVVSYVTNRSSI